MPEVATGSPMAELALRLKGRDKKMHGHCAQVERGRQSGAGGGDTSGCVACNAATAELTYSWAAPAGLRRDAAAHRSWWLGVWFEAEVEA